MTEKKKPRLEMTSTMLPKDLKKIIKLKALESNRSLSSEIAFALREYYSPKDPVESLLPTITQ